MEIDLPAYEDIYDFNEADLTFYQSKITACFKSNQTLSEKFQRKGQKILELIQIELEERIAVNQITSFCTKELSSDLYKEVFSDEISQVSTEIRDSEELSQAPSESKEESVSEKLWNMRKTKKNYKDFVRNTLKNTQQGVGLVIGGSSVPVKVLPKVEEKPNEKLKDLKPKPPAKTQDTKKTIEKKTDQRQILRNPTKTDEKNTKKVVPGKINDDKNSKKNELKDAKDKNKSSAQSIEKGIPKKNIKEEAKVKGAEKINSEKGKSLKNDIDGSGFSEKPIEGKYDNEAGKNSLIDEMERNDDRVFYAVLSGEKGNDSSQKEIFTNEDEGKEKVLDIVKDSQGSQVKEGNLFLSPKSVQSTQLIENTEIETNSIQASKTKKSPDLVKTEKITAEDYSSYKDPEKLRESQDLKAVINKVSLKEKEIQSDLIQKNFDDSTETVNFVVQDSKADSLALSTDIKPDKTSQVEPSNIRKLPETSESASKVEFQYENNKKSEDHNNVFSKPSSSESLECQEPLSQVPKSPYIRKTEPNFESYKPDEAGLADLKALKQKILASKLLPKNPGSISQDPVPAPAPVPETEEVTESSKAEALKSLKPKVQAKPKKPSEVFTDYSSHYSSFFEIFAGCSINKDFSALQTLRDCLTTFREFVSLIDSPEFEVHKKFKLTLAPLEINPRDLVRGEESYPVFPCEKEMYYRVVKARPEVYDIVSRGLNKKKAWSELPHGMNLRMSWNLMWTWSKPSLDFSKLLVWQQVNHFPETKNFSRKDMLKKNIEKVAKISAKAGSLWNIIPVTYILPKEYVTFVDHYGKLEETEPDTNVWIMKPVGKSRGRGISVINDVNQVSYGEVMVIQRYISNPLLLEGFKFDLRLYILITKFHPLEAFIYKEGFARISTVPFSMNPDKLHNKFIHLTNSSIQKYNHNKEESLDSILGGTKICLKTLKERLQKMGISWDKIWKQIIEVVLKSLVAVQSEIPSYSCCFDLVGYDVMIDQNLQTWLVEINSSPSLARENYLDDLIKQQLIDDTLDLVNPLYFNKQELVKVLERRVAEVQKGHVNNTVAQLNQDLHKILDGKIPRKYGELPEKIGNFDMISPSSLYEKLYKIANPRS